MFQSAVNKLTAWYIAGIVLVCLLFSFPIYNVTSRRLQVGAVRQTQFIERLPAGGPAQEQGHQQGHVPDLIYMRDRQLEDDRWQLLKTMAIVNVLIIGGGSYLSYWFAKRTFKPIEEAHEAQARFTADASHELRTPLATMQTEIEVALRDKKLGVGSAKDVLNSNLEEIARLRSLSDQLLALTRLDGNGITLQNVQISQAVEAELASLKKQYGPIITSDVQKNLNVQGDERLLRQVLSILVDNAVRYSGEQTPKIHVSLAEHEHKLQLSVQDNGVGIKAGELPHIFDRFYRGSRANAINSTGHGLGLALAKEIIDKHHGTIDVKSSPNQGSNFTINLPI